MRCSHLLPRGLEDAAYDGDEVAVVEAALDQGTANLAGAAEDLR